MENRNKFFIFGYFILFIFIFLGLFWLTLSFAKDLKIKNYSQNFINLGSVNLKRSLNNLIQEKFYSYNNLNKKYPEKASFNSIPINNLTDQVAHLIFKSGYNNRNGQINPEDYKNIVSNVDINKVFKVGYFENNDLKTAIETKDNSRKIALLIFSSFIYFGPDSTTTKEALGNFDKNQDVKKIKSLTSELTEEINYLKSFSVPEKYKSLMVEYLNLLVQEKECYLAMVGYKKDPLKAYLAIPFLEKTYKNSSFFIIKAVNKFKADGVIKI